VAAPIRVLIVDDSALIRQMLRNALAVDPRIEVVGTAKTGVEAVELACALSPDVVTLDIEMPEMTGLEALPQIMRRCPSRVLMLSSLDDPDTTYQALANGATDFISKPHAGFATSLSDLSDQLIKKIKTAYRVSPDKRKLTIGDSPAPRPYPPKGAPAPSRPGVTHLVAIASSTGGPPALERVFADLDAGLPAAWLIVQHLPPGFTASLAKRLGKVSDIEFAEAAEGDSIEAGRAYLAPYGKHMVVAGTPAVPSVGLIDAAPEHGVRPAADPLMRSVAHVAGGDAIGVVLTGMGADGAVGLACIGEAGGWTVAQDEPSSVVWGMPGAAVRLGAARSVVPLDHVAVEIRRALRGGRRSS
jgi:two-component system chemotaxis response regulator CheB